MSGDSTKDTPPPRRIAQIVQELEDAIINTNDPHWALILLDAIAVIEGSQKLAISTEKAKDVRDNVWTELERAYRAVQGLYSVVESHCPAQMANLAHLVCTIAAAKRFVFHGKLEGSDYFIGKHVSVLHAALANKDV